MSAINLIHEVKRQARDNWVGILFKMGIEVPLNQHTACPSCGGKDRFRFDNKGGDGSFVCNQCGAGDGLDLVQRVLGVSVTDAAKEVASIIGINTQSNNTHQQDRKPKSEFSDSIKGESTTSQYNELSELMDQQTEKLKRFTTRYNSLQTTQGESEYLIVKGLTGFQMPLLLDGALLIPLINAGGEITGAQTIKANGEKRLLADSIKKGSYYPVNTPANITEVIIAEGLATALTCHLIRPSALTIAAIDAGNLIHVARVMRDKHPSANLIIAGDNDIGNDKNTGKEKAEAAARLVNGYVSLPPTSDKADWDDYRQENGMSDTVSAFNSSLYQPQEECKAVQLEATKRRAKQSNNGYVDLAQMAASQRGVVLAEYYGEIGVNIESGIVYVFNGSVWERVEDSALRRSMSAIFIKQGTPYSPKGIDAAIDAMKLQIPVIGEQRKDLIGFKNGVYDLSINRFSPHSADNWLMNHNGITYTDPKHGENLATHAPNFSKWINHAAGGDTRKVTRIEAALFMILANRYDWQLFLEVTGEGGSGKSVFSGIAAILAGEHNTASGSMEALDSARGRAQFIGKSLIILPDQRRYVGEGTGIKSITGGDLVEIDAKYKQQYSAVIQAVVLATNNEPMTFTERNGGVARRRVIFPFNNSVKDEDKDTGLMDKIRQEIPVIIRHLFNQFSDQNKAKDLLIEQRGSQEALDIKRGTDPIIDICSALLFMTEPKGMMMGGGSMAGQLEARKYLYHFYLTFLEHQGLGKPLSVERFSRAIKSAAKEYEREYMTRKIKGRTQTNVALKDEANEFMPRAYDIEDI